MPNTTKPPKPEERTDAQVWAELTAPFPEDWVERLPKPLRRDDNQKGKCQPSNSGGTSPVSADGHHCGGWHSRAVHLDYVGHAGITMRLNDVLGPWGWDFTPYADGPDGTPVMDRNVFWARLTVRVGDQEVTKVELAANYSGQQEAYGDALRRCAMRFGVGTYLWSKSEQAHQRAVATDEPPEPEPEPEPHGAPAPFTPAQEFINGRVQGYDKPTQEVIVAWWKSQQLPPVGSLSDQAASHIVAYLDKRDAEHWADPT